jgi:hypothetical protein
MPYGARGYGGFAVGDPFIHKKIFKGLGKVAGAALRIAQVVPGPVGMGARLFAGGGLRTPAPRFMPPPPAPTMPPISLRARDGARAAVAPVGGDGCPKGYRLNRSDYFLKDGTFVPAGTRCVRMRRTNPTNVRALRRALRREEQFIRLARRTGLVRVPRFKRSKKK